jgi:hypothetical protein
MELEPLHHVTPPHRDPLVGLPGVLALGRRPTRDLHARPNRLAAAEGDRPAHHLPLTGLVGVAVPRRGAAAAGWRWLPDRPRAPSVPARLIDAYPPGRLRLSAFPGRRPYCPASQVFILSAGWGPIPAAFLTPYYDITFSASADAWKRRRKDDRYEDFCRMGDDGDESIFLGGKDYLPLFCRLTAVLRGRKTVFFNSSDRPVLPAGFTPVRYRTTTRTNWHYECALDLAAEKNRRLR